MNPPLLPHFGKKKNFILSTKDTSTKFGVPVVLENKFSCKVET